VVAEPVSSGFSGLRVAAFESRLADQMAQLIERYGGRPLVAPSMREVPLEENQVVLDFGERLMAGEFAMVILLTGVGTRLMLKVLDTRRPREQTRTALGRTTLVVRGPKPAAVLREEGLKPSVTVPEPNTWKELVQAIDRMGRPLAGMTVAVQEYGVTNESLLGALKERGATVVRVPVYQWALPVDLGPLTRVVRALMADEVDVVLFTNAVQVDHVLRVAEQAGGPDRLRQSLQRIVVASVGPTAADHLRACGLPVDLEPSHSKMGILVKETSERAAEILRGKRAVA
jgi:uroporphyrinogen-III synthase